MVNIGRLENPAGARWRAVLASLALPISAALAALLVISCGGSSGLSSCGVQCDPGGACPSGFVCNAAHMCADSVATVCDDRLVADAAFVDVAVDASVADAPVVDASNEVCNVLADTGCQAGNKCTWVIDSWSGPEATGHVDCRPVGTVALGGACMIGTGGSSPQGADNCGKGLYCTGGVCKPVCDLNGGPPNCGANFTCQPYLNTFGNAGEPARAGLCDPSCDPLTNRVDGTNEANCKATSIDTNTTTVPGFPAGYPNRGCYGLWISGGKSRWTCAAAGPATGVQDFEPSRVFVNSCAPGYGAFLVKMSGSMQAICSAMCNPGDAFMGAAPTEIGGKKRGTDFSTCSERGATGFDCLHGWFLEVADDNTVTETKYSTLGVCIQWPRFVSAVTNMAFKKCNELVKNDADPAADAAFNQGCRPLTSHPLLAGAITLPWSNAATLLRYFRPAFPPTMAP